MTHHSYLLIAPLEQFNILPILRLGFPGFDLSISQATIILLVGLGAVLSLPFLVHMGVWNTEVSRPLLCVVPGRWQSIGEILYKSLYQVLYDNLGSKGKEYFAFVFTVFLFVCTANLIGLVPYSFTLTTQLSVTLSIATMVFVGVVIVGSMHHGINFLGVFLPPGTSLGLSLILIPIEVVSFFFKPISIGVRLFANIMAGHTLLKVIAGFAWSIISSNGIIFIFHILPLVILVVLIGLELAVALIQAYVFTVLTCIYINDSVNLH